jgi:hypothetical protein
VFLFMLASCGSLQGLLGVPPRRLLLSMKLQRLLSVKHQPVSDLDLSEFTSLNASDRSLRVSNVEPSLKAGALETWPLLKQLRCLPPALLFVVFSLPLLSKLRVLAVLVAHLPGREDRHPEPIGRPGGVGTIEGSLDGLLDLKHDLGRNILPALEVNALPLWEAYIEHLSHGFMEVVVLSSAMDPEASRIHLAGIPVPLSSFPSRSTRASVPTTWDTSPDLVDNLWVVLPGREPEQGSRPALNNIGRQAPVQLISESADPWPPRRVCDLIAVRFATIRVGTPDEYAAVQQRGEGALHGGLAVPQPSLQHPDGQWNPVEAVALVWPQERGERLLQNIALLCG